MNQRALFIPSEITLAEMQPLSENDGGYQDRIEAAERAGAARVQGIGEHPEVLEPGKTRTRRDHPDSRHRTQGSAPTPSLRKQQRGIPRELDQVRTKLEDAKLVIGNEIMKQTRAYFQNSKNASESGNEQLRVIYTELKPHYAVGRNSKKAAASVEL